MTDSTSGNRNNGSEQNSGQASQILIHNSLAQNLQHLKLPYSGAISSRSRRRSDTRLNRSRSRERAQSMSQSREMVLVDSKERLSEMATNIRGISNALSNVALTPKVQNVFIITKINDDELLPKTRELVEWLLNWVPDDDCDSSDEQSVAIESDEEVEKLTREKAVSEGVLNNESALDDSDAMHTCCMGNLIVHVEDIIANDPQFDLEGLKRDNPEFADNIKLWSPDSIAQMSDKLDLAITLGGDGTVLYTSWLFQKIAPPTLSFALGSLGFMTENQYEDYSSILDDHLLHGIRCSLRMRFECCILRSRNRDKNGSDVLAKEIKDAAENKRFTTHYKECEYTILNEVVADRGPNPFVTMTELYGDYELLTCIKADGVVISTPTGSTAYSMSAGGSLVHPEVPAQLISPICPHTLSFRPLVVPDSMVLHLGVPYDSRSSAFVSFDGKTRVELDRGDILAIHVSRYPFPKVLPPGNSSVSWVQQLSRTLHWNEQKRPKTYT